MNCLKYKLTFRVFTVDPNGKEHDTEKEWSIDLQRYNQFHNSKDTFFNESRLGPIFLKDFYGFTGNYVHSHVLLWTVKYTEAKINYNGRYHWCLRRII